MLSIFKWSFKISDIGSWCLEKVNPISRCGHDWISGMMACVCVSDTFAACHCKDAAFCMWSVITCYHGDGVCHLLKMLAAEFVLPLFSSCCSEIIYLFTTHTHFVMNASFLFVTKGHIHNVVLFSWKISLYILWKTVVRNDSLFPLKGHKPTNY